MPASPKQSRATIAGDLAKALADAIRGILPLGRRSDTQSVDRVADILRDFESRVKRKAFHNLIYRGGAITVAAIPAPSTQFPYDALRNRPVQPPGKSGSNPSHTGNSVLWVYTVGDGQCDSITEVQTDGMIFGANTSAIGRLSKEEKFVPAHTTESVIISTVANYFTALKELNALLPWTICVSLLDVKGYRLYSEDTDASDRIYAQIDIRPEPIVLRTIDEPFDRQNVARILKPTIDFIWREFGFPCAFSYTRDGIYNRRVL